MLAAQVGKSGASWIAQALLLALGSIAAALPIIAAIFGAVIAAWLVLCATSTPRWRCAPERNADWRAGLPLKHLARLWSDGAKYVGQGLDLHCSLPG